MKAADTLHCMQTSISLSVQCMMGRLQNTNSVALTPSTDFFLSRLFPEVTFFSEQFSTEGLMTQETETQSFSDQVPRDPSKGFRVRTDPLKVIRIV